MSLENMDPELILSFGYAGLFAASFLAATLVPLGSEAAVAALCMAGFDPAWVWVVATAGNSLGALVNYFVGLWGADFLFSRFIQVDGAARKRAEDTYGRYGAPILFFAWLPVVGDPLTVVAGGLKVRLPAFVFWVVLGKGFRYAVLVAGLMAAMD